ncbi:MAG: hypothetical protein NC240_06790 [Clostridium sp.]|nr:hypothetical protein [Clostridium sp.]
MGDISSGFFIGFLVAWIATVVLAVYRRRKKSNGTDDYDERQQLVRYRGYQYCFFIMVAFLACTCLVESVMDKHVIDTDAVAIIGICLSVGVHVSYCIWNEGYFPVNHNRKSYIVMAVALSILYISFSIEAIKRGEVIVDGVLTGGCTSLACAAVFTITCIVLLLKSAMDKKEDEQQ